MVMVSFCASYMPVINTRWFKYLLSESVDGVMRKKIFSSLSTRTNLDGGRGVGVMVGLGVGVNVGVGV